MSLSRRAMTIGMLDGAAVTATLAQTRNPAPLTTIAGAPTPSAGQARVLTVYELTEAELAGLDQAREAVRAATERVDRCISQLYERYGANVPGVEAHFEERYLFVRDYRQVIAEKERSAKALEAQGGLIGGALGLR